MLYTASFYDPQDWKGRRYRVSRGHPRGRRSQWETLPFVYPPRELLRAYREGTKDFAAFGAGYRCAMDLAYDQLEQFRAWVTELPGLGDFTLLCFERTGQPCHRLELAQWLLERAPGLNCGELR